MNTIPCLIHARVTDLKEWLHPEHPGQMEVGARILEPGAGHIVFFAPYDFARIGDVLVIAVESRNREAPSAGSTDPTPQGRKL